MSGTGFFLARRHSVKNEHDLLQEDYASDESSEVSLTTPPSSPYTQKTCHDLLSKVHYPDSPLPVQCEVYDDVKVALQRRNSDRATQAIAFQGMHAGQKAAAMASRENGQLHHAQIQRRMTNGKPRLW